MQYDSNLIMDAMKQVNGEILKFSPHTMDRLRLHNTIHRTIVANIHYLAALEKHQRDHMIDYILKMHLVDELSQYMKQVTQSRQ